MNEFERLKEICRVACHERGACRPGFEALMQADSIPAILAVWRHNWDDIFSSKFADVIVEHIAGVYATAGDEFRSARFFVNEPSERGIVIISGATEPIAVGGTAKAYIFSPAEVTATENAQVYCRTAGSRIILRGHSYAHVDSKDTCLEVREFASASGTMTCHTYNAAEVMIAGGTLIDHGHRRITASATATVIKDRGTKDSERRDAETQRFLNS
jgi:hypothetical protein